MHLYDYSWSHPDPYAMKSVPGCAGVVRYLSGGGSKDITPDEIRRLQSVGLWISLVWETTASREEHGYPAGVEDGRRASAQAEELGAPHGMVIWFADDNNDADPSQEAEYLDGARMTCRNYEVGQYGNGLVVQHAIDTGGYGWRVETWRPGDSPNPHMIQLANTKRPHIPGTPESWYDTNIVNKPFPMWGPNGVVEDDMAISDEQMQTLGKWMQDQRDLTLKVLIGDHDPATDRGVLASWETDTRRELVTAITKIPAAEVDDARIAEVLVGALDVKLRQAVRAELDATTITLAAS
jgi:hypothetical protein